MNWASQPVTAYLATLAAIVVLTLTAAIVCVTVDAETKLAQIVAALGFISAAVTGLIGVIGTFRPKGGVEPAGTRSDPIATEEVR
ncbi:MULTISPECIES: hypothetical protein [unclassified Sphingomonas]|uniref:hypothetical protein n=1 Tax=unclassified Sphingomonas TaxID=196159 RepID=UPI0006F3A096|nr:MULTISPECIES: hypothetical protein [unclassified Sphingomonas]KQM60050.1 hypothetical protein ASE65_10110 [Sphingomonas sp. Leaf16]KQN11448.1 hypothetical protein ASE81_11095 [Sphingomonas sp. Leaf29]KQN18770.1 hypothetical protein ASE83_11035 [Sphingomonas sp. Leaf32]